MSKRLPTYNLDQLKSTDEDIKRLFYKRTFFYYSYSSFDELTNPEVSFRIFRLNTELQDEFINIVKHVVRADLIDILCYKYVKEYSYQKIADIMGIKKTSVGSKLTSGREEITKVIIAFDKEYIKTYADKANYKIESKNETKNLSEDKYVYVVIVDYNSGYLNHNNYNIDRFYINISMHVLSDETKAHQYAEKFIDYFISLHPDDWDKDDWFCYKTPNYNQLSNIIYTYGLLYNNYKAPIVRASVVIHKIKLDEFKIEGLDYEF